MNIHDHPNTKEYLAHFLLTLRKHSVLEDTSVFDLEIDESGELPDCDRHRLQ